MSLIKNLTNLDFKALVGTSPTITVGLGAVVVLGLNLASIYDTNEDEEKRQGIDIASAFMISLVFATIVARLLPDVAKKPSDFVEGFCVLALVGLVVSRSLQNTGVGAAEHGSQICSTVKFLLIGFILAVYCRGGGGGWKYCPILLTVALGIAGQWVKDEDEDRKTQKGLDTAAQVVLFITILLVALPKKIVGGATGDAVL